MILKLRLWFSSLSPGHWISLAQQIVDQASPAGLKQGIITLFRYSGVYQNIIPIENNIFNGH